MNNDHTAYSAPRRVRDHLGAEADELLKGRFGIVNVWRPIRGRSWIRHWPGATRAASPTTT